MSRHAASVTLNGFDRRELEHWVNAHRTPQQVAQRCRIILAAAKGHKDKDIAESMKIVGFTPHTLISDNLIPS